LHKRLNSLTFLEQLFKKRSWGGIMEPGLAALAGVFRRLVPVLIVTSLCSDVAVAQDWPTKAIRAIVPLTAGSATDMIGRTVLDQLSQQIGQPIVV
jgi:hypothetical protein